MIFNLSTVFCAHNGVLLLEQNGLYIVIGLLNIDDKGIRTKIESRYSQYLRHYSSQDINDANGYITYKSITKDFFIKETSRRFSSHKDLEPFLSQQAVSNSENLEYLIEDAPIIHLLNSLLLECIGKEGSDIHIEPFEDGSRIRMRILGELELYSVIDTKTSIALILRILFLAKLDITENRRSQDGSFHFEVGSTTTEVRVSVLPSMYGLSCVLRLLNCKNFMLNIDNLGFLPTHRDFLESACTKNNALLLVCGATGAGKSTTLAAMLNRLVDQQRKIITIEDPVEYRLDGIVQIPVKPDLDMDFSQVLRSTFRHDPDVIMIGEIRDENTARIALRAALTGHLVLASLHTLDAPSAIIRLLEMGIESWLLAAVFGGVLCQRLVKQGTGSKKKYIPIAEYLPSCTDITKLIMKKAGLYEFREWMNEHGIENMQEEILYAICN